MTSFAALMFWLLQTPRWFFAAYSARTILNEAARLLIDPATDRLRDLGEAELRALERALQIADSGVSLATWLLARALSGRAPPRSWRLHREAPSSRPLTVFSLARRADALCRRLDSLQSSAIRLSRRLARDAGDATEGIQRSREYDSPNSLFASRYARTGRCWLNYSANYSTCWRNVFSYLGKFRSNGVASGFGQTGPPHTPPPHCRSV